MKRTTITKATKKIGEEVTLSGWVQTARAHGKIAFMDLRDRTGMIQVGAFSPELAVQIGQLHSQDIVSVVGKMKKRDERYINQHVLFGDFEMEASSLEILHQPADLPFDMGGKDLHLELPTLLDYRALTLRHPKQQAIFHLQAEIAEGFRKSSKELGCLEIFTPTIAASATEGGAEVFGVDYYGHPAFMVQSPQLYKQIMVGVFERVYTIAHAYRAEPSVTTRHLAEVVQLDCEIAFIEDFSELLDALEYVGTKTIQYAADTRPDILSLFGQDKPLIPPQVPRLTLAQAQEIIYEGTKRDVRGEKDLSPEDEKEICQWAHDEKQSDFVTITHFPLLKRAFYTMPDPNDPNLSLSYDLLFRGIEISSGSQRINEYPALVNAIESRGLNPKSFGMYLQAFKYGMPKEGGFSFGLERITMKLLGLGNVRQASLLPRDMERVDERFSTTKETSQTS